MKQNNNLAWFFVVIAVICWSLYEIYPPTSGDLLAAFSNRAENKDATFSAIVTEAEALQKTGTNSEFSAFLRTRTAATDTPEQREALFREFVQWQQRQHARVQPPH